MKTVPPAGGFWELGEFDKNHPGMTNPWRGASRMAPFDQEVFHYNTSLRFIFYFTKKKMKISKAVIRIRKSKKDRQYNGEYKYKRTNNDLQNTKN